ncbi:hypothetical protein Tco_1166804 [Tanacetum coccineum]
MANFATKHSIMTQEMVDSFCNSFYIPAEVHPTAPERGKTISEFPAEMGLFDFSKTADPRKVQAVEVQKGADQVKLLESTEHCFMPLVPRAPGGSSSAAGAKVSAPVEERLEDVAADDAYLDDGLFSFAKRSTSAPTCFSKPPDSIKNWADHFFWVDSRVFPISVPLYTGGILEKDPAPHLTTRQEQAVKLLESHKAPFRRYPECFLCLVGLSPYYPFDENSYPAFEYPDGTEMGLFDFIKTADPRKVQAVEVHKGADQVKLLESTEHCFMPLVPRAPGGSSSAAGAEVSALIEERLEDVVADDAYLELVDPSEDTVVARRGKTLAGLEQIKSAGSRLLAWEQSATPSVAPPSQESKSFVDLSAQASLQIRTTVGSSSTLSAPVDIAAATTTFTKAKLVADVNQDLVGPSQLEESKGSDDSFYELAALDPSEAKRWSRAEHELELKEKLNAKYAARGKLLEKKDSEILRLKSQLAEKEAETEEVVRLRDQVSSLSREKSALTAEVSTLKVTITQKEYDISLLDSHATHLESALNDAQVACTKAGIKITLLASERDRLAYEVSSLRVGFKDFKEKMEIQQGEQAQELHNRVAELEDVMDVFGRLEGEFCPTYLTLLVGRRWLLTHGIQLALLKYLKSSEYQGILGHALGRAMDFGMQ